MKLGIYETLKKASEQKKKEDRIKVIKDNMTDVMVDVLRLAYDDRIEWALPEGDPPYTPNPLIDQQSSLYVEGRKFYLFIKGGHPTLAQVKREALFIAFLQNIDKDDATLILACKNRTLPFKTLPKDLITGAFPDFFMTPEVSEAKSDG